MFKFLKLRLKTYIHKSILTEEKKIHWIRFFTYELKLFKFIKVLKSPQC